MFPRPPCEAEIKEMEGEGDARIATGNELSLSTARLAISDGTSVNGWWPASPLVWTRYVAEATLWKLSSA